MNLSNQMYLILLLYTFVAVSKSGLDRLWNNQLQDFEYSKKNDQFMDPEDSLIQEEVNWPSKDVLADIKQVAAVEVDQIGNVHVFHRGNRLWDVWSFDRNDNYQQQDLGPIKVDAILVLEQSSGEIIKSWGKNRFYLPHGLTLDNEGNSWLTDVALHQVMKFNKGEEEPSLILGKKFEHGSDKEHFCKPTDVAVLSDGYFYVSDGYCNSRIVAFKPDGSFHQEFGSKENMNVPHSLSLIEERNMLCVADRENARILCYSLGLQKDTDYGQLSAEYKVYLGAVYAIDHKENLLFAVTGPKTSYSEAWGLTMDLNNGNIFNMWNSLKGFSMPHDVAISSNGTYLYVADAGQYAPKKLCKFLVLI